jgi:hypothetical protein
LLAALALFAFCFFAAVPARAQLATSFYTITGVETRRLPNAVQVIVRTDGAVLFGGDLSEWVEMGENIFEGKQTRQFRLRLVGARARIPAFNAIGAYPLDSLQVTLGRDALTTPYFPFEAEGQPEPRVDLLLRFFVPIKVHRFQVQRYNGFTRQIVFGASLDPLDVEVRLGDDRRSIVITAITDRVDAAGGDRTRRIAREDQKSRLAAGRRRNGDLSISALHIPLPELLDTLSNLSGVPIVARPSLSDERVTISLDAPLETILQTLERGLGLSLRRRSEDEGGGWEAGRDDVAETRRIPLRNISPERARLLLPDFLLSSLRVDSENNALVASASPAVLDKIARDLEVLDRRRPRVRVQAEVFEVSARESDVLAFNLAFGQRGLAPTRDAPNPNYIPPAVEIDGRGVAVFRLENGGEGGLSSWRVQLEALAQRGRVRLRAKPFVTVLSGELGTLFLGQSRFIPVLRSRGGQQDVQALRVPVGYSLNARPRVVVDESRPEAAHEISLSISPRASTVDDIERGTGLPTLGIREVSTSVRLQQGDALLIAGMDVDSNFSTRNRRTPARRGDDEKTRLLVVVTAQVLAEAGGRP